MSLVTERLDKADEALTNITDALAETHDETFEVFIEIARAAIDGARGVEWRRLKETPAPSAYMGDLGDGAQS